MYASKTLKKTCVPIFRYLLGIDKEMAAYYKPKSMKDLVMHSKLKVSDNSKLQGTHVSKQAGNATEIDIKDKVDKIFEEEGVTENMLNRLNSTLNLEGKEVGQNTCSKLLFVKGKKKD